MLRHCQEYPYATGSLVSAIDLAILQLQIATGRNLAALLDASITSEESMDASKLTLNLQKGVLTCWRALKTDQLCSLKIDQGWKPGALAPGVFGL